MEYLVVSSAARPCLDVPIDRRPLPDTLGEAQIHTLAPGACLYVWSGGASDFSFATSDDGEAVVFNGYVTGLPSTQKSFASALMEKLKGLESVESIGALANSLNGCFSFIYLSRHGTYCVTDRVSSRPLWRLSMNGVRYFSGNALTAACCSGNDAIDSSALASFLLYGGSEDPTHSLISGVRAVPEASVIRMTEAPDERLYRWYTFAHTPDRSRTRSEWARLIADRLRDAATRVQPVSPNPLLFLSGGIDSRLCASALCAANIRPSTVTLSDGENLETRVAARVAATFGCENRLVQRDKNWYLRSMPRSTFLSQGLMDYPNAHFFEALGGFRVPCEATVFLGDFGEAFSKLLVDLPGDGQSPLSPEEFLRRYDQIRLPLYRPVNRTRTLQLLRPEAQAAAVAQLEADILTRYDAAMKVASDAAIVCDYYFRGQNASCARTYHMFNDVMAAAPVRNLYFDRAVAGLLETLPSEYRQRANLGIEIVRLLAPRAARVPNANTMLPAVWPPWTHQLMSTLRPYAGRVRRALVSNTYKTTASWPHYPLLYAQDVWRAHLDAIFHEKSLFDDRLFDHSEVQRAHDEFVAGDLTRHHDVERLFQYGTAVAQVRGRRLPSPTTGAGFSPKSAVSTGSGTKLA